MANLSAALSGAGSGAVAGSAFGGGWGAIPGAIIGGVSGLLGGGGKKDKQSQVSTQLPQQRDYLLNLIQQLQSQGGQGGNYNQAQNYLGSLLSGSPEAYQKFAAPHLTQFQEQTIPMLAERFAGLGGGLGGGALGSTGFGQAIGGAGAQLQSNLANLYAQLQQQAAQSALGQYNTLSSMALGSTAFQPTYQPGQLGPLEQASSAFLGGVGSNLGKGVGLSLSQRISNALNPEKTSKNPASTNATGQAELQPTNG